MTPRRKLIYFACFTSHKATDLTHWLRDEDKSNEIMNIKARAIEKLFRRYSKFPCFSCFVATMFQTQKEKKLADHGRAVTKDSLTIPVTAKKSVNNTLQHVKTAHCSESMLGCIVIFISHVVTHGVFQRIFFWCWKFRLIMTAAQVVLLWSNNLHLGFISFSRTKFSLNRAIC